MRICFQFVTRTKAVINSEAEEHESIEKANDQARTWMELKDRTISFVTYTGEGASIRTNEIEHITAMPESLMESLHENAFPAPPEKSVFNALIEEGYKSEDGS